MNRATTRTRRWPGSGRRRRWPGSRSWAAAAPDAGLFSSLVHAADRLGDEEILSNALIILFGGIETTDATLANTVWGLLSCTRYATQDVELAGTRIEAGDVVQCMLGAANRDPGHFPDPDRFDVVRPNAADHLTFGVGRHLCLGSHLARAETRMALPALFGGLKGLRLDPDAPARPAGYEFRKPERLMVRWTALG